MHLQLNGKACGNRSHLRVRVLRLLGLIIRQKVARLWLWTPAATQSNKERKLRKPDLKIWTEATYQSIRIPWTSRLDQQDKVIVSCKKMTMPSAMFRLMTTLVWAILRLIKACKTSKWIKTMASLQTHHSSLNNCCSLPRIRVALSQSKQDRFTLTALPWRVSYRWRAWVRPSTAKP